MLPWRAWIEMASFLFLTTFSGFFSHLSFISKVILEISHFNQV